MTDFIRWTLKIYPSVIYTAAVYLFVLLMKAIGLYENLDSDNAILVIAYISILHLVAIPCLIYALRHSTQFYIIFLVVNAAWLALCTTYLLYLLVIKPETIGWSGNPLNHMLVLWYWLMSLTLEVLVFLHKDTLVVYVETSSALAKRPQSTQT